VEGETSVPTKSVLEVPDISIDAIVLRLQSADVCGRCEWRIENNQCASREKCEVYSLHDFAGTNVSPHEKMATPERGKPRSLQKHRSAPNIMTVLPKQGFRNYRVQQFSI
jgi:hypothetical protein